jgi:hypothetical protein
MRPLRFACLFVSSISTMMVGQSNPIPPTNQSARAVSSSAVSKRPSFRGTAARQTAPMQTSGLNFEPAVTYDSGAGSANSAAVTDVNGDGKPDLIVLNGCQFGCNANYGSLVGVLLGNGDGTFQTAETYDAGSGLASSLAVADVNRDGKPDLLVANGESVAVVLGNGDGTFQAPVNCGGSEAQAVAVADVNGDGKPDLLVADGGNNGGVSVLLGNGDGTFQTAVTYGSGGYVAQSVAVADVNGDGKPDLVVANACADSNCDTNGVVGVLLGNGDGTFQTAVPYSSVGYYGTSVAVADVNGDGKPDLLVVNQATQYEGRSDGVVGVLLGNGDGTFQTAVPYSSGASGSYSVAVVDVNGDGKPDLLVANQCGETGRCSDTTVGVLIGNGDGTFQTAVTYGTNGVAGWGGDLASSLAVADVNGDGKPDLLVANQCVNFGCSGDATVGVLINASLTPTTTALTSSQNPSNFGQSVTFTATVMAQPGFDKGVPTGTVSFFDGTTNIGNSNLNNNGVGTLTTSTLAVGTHSITVTYNGDTNFAPSTSPVLNQVVQGAIVSLSPTSLNFGNQTVGITSQPQVTTLTNTGNINLTISLIQITGTNNGDFAQTNNCGSSVAPNGTCKITVTFTPLGTGERTAAVSIKDNAPGSPQTVPLSGTGVLPSVTFSPTSLTFPTQLVFTSSKAQPVTLTNTGLGILTITKIAVSGQFAQTNTCGSTVAPGGNCTISVTFKPKTKGTLKGSVSVTDNAPDSPQTVPLTGTGT